MVISGSLGEHLVPKLHDRSQIESIFIFCGDRNRHLQWAKDWSKIKGVFTDIPRICKALQQASPEYKSSSSNRSNEPNLSFAYTKILKEVFLSIKFHQSDIRHFADYCRQLYADNKSELAYIDKFREKYPNPSCVWWYSVKCFLSITANRALRTMDMNILIRMGFFLSDLHRQIEQLHSEQLDDHPDAPVTLYRAESMPQTTFQQIVEKKGGLLLFNSFLTTTKKRPTSLDSKRDMVIVLSIIKIDPFQASVSFAHLSEYPADHEVLFSTHTIFRVENIQSVRADLFEVHLTLVNEPDDDLRILTDDLRKEVGQIVLNRIPDEGKKGSIYHQLGLNEAKKDRYHEALSYYEKVVGPSEKTLPALFNDMGVAYEQTGKFVKALKSGRKPFLPIIPN